MPPELIESQIRKLTTLQLNKFTKSIWWILFMILFFLLMIWGGLLWLLWAIISILVLSAFWLQSIASYSWLLILLWIVYAPLKTFRILEKNDPFRALPNNTLKIYKIFQETPFSVEKIDTIIALTDSTRQELISLHKFEKFWFLFSQKSRINIIELKSLIFPIIYAILRDLQKDILHHTEVQISKLQKAKSTVEQNITGTIELEQVSELQKARLDRQIEQFEELQKILVRV